MIHFTLSCAVHVLDCSLQDGFVVLSWTTWSRCRRRPFCSCSPGVSLLCRRFGSFNGLSYPANASRAVMRTPFSRTSESAFLPLPSGIACNLVFAVGQGRLSLFGVSSVASQLYSHHARFHIGGLSELGRFSYLRNCDGTCFLHGTLFRTSNP